MDGNKYEKRVASYLRDKGFKHVTITKTSGDYGVDIIANKHFHKYAVQCKYYSKPVGIAAVQQVVAGMAYYECDRAMVITNSSFTRQAIQLAEHNNVELLANIMPRSSLFQDFLLRLCGIAGLYCLYKLGYWLIVVLILFCMLLLFILWLFLKSQMNKDSDNNIDYSEE